MSFRHLTKKIPKDCFNIVKNLPFNDVVAYAQGLGYNVTESVNPERIYTLVLYGVSYLFFSIPPRLEVKKSLHKSLRKIELEDGEACTWHIGKRKLLGQVALGKLIGYGTYGSVYSASMYISEMEVDTEFVLKFAGIQQIAYERLKSGWNSSKPWYIPYVLRELVVHYFINHLIKQKICPNFVLMVDWFLCNRCDNLYTKKKIDKNWKQIKVPDQPCIIYALEKFDGDCKDLVKNIVPREKWSNIAKKSVFNIMIFQVIYALAVLQKYYGVDQSDSGIRNIFWKKILSFESPLTYWTYIYDGVEYHIPNIGYTFSLADYGLSVSNRIFGVYGIPHEQKQTIGFIRKQNQFKQLPITRLYENERITYDLPEGSSKDDLDPFYNPGKFFTREAGFVSFVQDVKTLSSLRMVDKKIANYLTKIVIELTGKSPDEAIEDYNNIPPVNYSRILWELFGELFTNVPNGGIEIGRYSADEPLDISIDEQYLKYLRKIY
jgi:hypothetical protein